jgi:hypothetical protein
MGAIDIETKMLTPAIDINEVNVVLGFGDS